MTSDDQTLFGDLPARAAARWGDREGLFFNGQRFSFNDIARSVDRAARGLIALGVRPGDKVGVWLTNSPLWIELMFALAKIGAVQVPINTRFRSHDLDYVLRQSDCSTLITHTVSGPIDYLSMVRELVPPQAHDGTKEIRSDSFPHLRRVVVAAEAGDAGTFTWPEVLARADAVTPDELQARASSVRLSDLMLILYTSGTQGFPKGVMRDHRQLLDHHNDRLAASQLSADDVILNYLPLFHSFGYIDGPLSSIRSGARQVLTERFDADQTLDLIAQERATVIYGFETHLNDLVNAQLKRRRDTSSLRVGIFAASAKSSAGVLRRAREELAPLQTLMVYGSTEVGANATISSLDSTLEQATETCGKPCRGYHIRVVDPLTRQDLPPGELGEIIAKSDNVMTGYYNNPQATAAAFDADGFYKTGDIGYLRPDGYLRFLTRYKDMLKVGGENVDPAEVESYIMTLPGVAQVAVVAYPDQRLSEVAVAFVVAHADSGLSEQAIIEHCRGKIASFKIPRRVWLVDAIPMTPNGKTKKEELRGLAKTLVPAFRSS